MTDQGFLKEGFARGQPDQHASELAAKGERAVSSGLLRNALEAIPEIILILNGDRQITYANKVLRKILGLSDSDSSVCGLLPGDVFNCKNSKLAPGGCGNSAYCRECGATNAILESQREARQCAQECRITAKSGDALDLRVTATPLEVDGEKYTILDVKDIGDEKRRRALERIFFHDILNLAGGIRGGTELLREVVHQDAKPLLEMINLASDTLAEEILAQRDLILAERGELRVSIEELNPLELLQKTMAIYSRHAVARGKIIYIDPAASKQLFKSSKTLLLRVLGNMLKNALEATSVGQSVWMAGRTLPDGQVEFLMRNPGCMPEKVRLQIFQRSFSTKGEGRGLGTYSVKFLTERYLGGSVGFESDEAKGTTSFFVRLRGKP